MFSLQIVFVGLGEVVSVELFVTVDPLGSLSSFAWGGVYSNDPLAE